jgi:hypothetical protein
MRRGQGALHLGQRKRRQAAMDDQETCGRVQALRYPPPSVVRQRPARL